MPAPPTPEDRNPEASLRELLTLGSMFLCAIALLIWLLNFSVNWLIVQMPVSWEQRLGQALVKIYEPQAEPSPAQDELNALLDRLEAEIPTGAKEKRDYQLLYIPQHVVNAAALPGDTVLVYQGLLDQMDSENALMMVLGHEIGHFANRDHLRNIGRALVIRTVISSIFGDVSWLGDVAQIVSTSRFSQAQEKQADEYGLDLLYATYGQVAGATDFFEAMSQKQGANWDFLATHPAPAKRVQHLKTLIQQRGYPIGEYTPLPEVLTQD
ncbi:MULTISPECIES: M48 family metallopeptidase [Cyanophyceae]|uniref:M48 family metallopeptidase n=1 Tax=Cyanophyceae TaxID=3028117 RepID=UPI0002E2CE23|nr:MULTISPECIES: M48 family metallopeptidase [Cyanophyceae]SMH40610.1 Zn-dependent protease with chaperone function [Picosynechococcus sp. OG1]SMQ78425.1 Zn-dependent protease with chaperone function [Synechococcus sp. 7002]